ncbi:hypothetical protein QP716_23265 [Citrobacter freundii]|uniref:hypothetical protein n=1 Tax=Enterobacteriaceae TaxID=543 RepID=UPI00255002CD|nr:hypothetical protein [Citrobacter freundii]MDK8080656.1 hypothetical protein [Citrobacter freundii]MDK8591680.1 hypothetical protein [Citrobacter freundii]
MKNKFNRSVEHLIRDNSSEKIIESIQAVSELFTEEWLKKNDGHRLQILWARRDHLSTTELYCLGQSILNLSQDNRRWLKSTAKEIKKNADSSHGLITEIITIGSLSTDGGVIKPCATSNPVFDYEISFDTGYKYKVSVKNFDISLHEKAFREKCETIRKSFKKLLERTGSSGKLFVLLEHDILTDEILNNICLNIAFKFDKHGLYEFENGRYSIAFHPINEYKAEVLNAGSDMVQVMARQHYNEIRNITDKIDEANRKLLSAPQDDKSIKQLVIRLGATTDFDKICSHINKISKEYENRGFDFIQVFQPQVVGDLATKKTSICTSLYIGEEMFFPAASNLEDKIKNFKMVKMQFPVGSVSMESIPQSFINEGVQTEIDIRPFYSYQQGDFYLKLKKKNNRYEGNLSSFYPGVLTHLVFENMTVSPVLFAQEDRLLIV